MSDPIETAYDLAMAAGRDAGDRNMRRAGRQCWNEEDWDVAADTVNALLGSPEDKDQP